ncbi:MAG TPA: cache domain-containing protein, partial [Gammaproteobacteria bacterium]
MNDKQKRAWLQRTFKLDIVVVFSSLIVVTMAAITAFTYVQNRRESLSLADRIMDQTAQAVIEKTIEYLSPAQTAAELSSELLRDEGIVIGPDSEIERFFMRIVANYPQISLVYFGDEQGNFSQASRDFASGNLVNRYIRRNVEPATETYYYRDAEGAVANRTVSDKVKYDPRLRPWYKGAGQGEAAFWTDIYIFNTGKVPGITAAYPVRTAGGELRGV